MARILHLVAANHRRGAETFAVELADHLRGAGHEVRVMAVQDAGRRRALPMEVAGTSRWDPRGLVRMAGAVLWADTVVSFGSSSLLVGSILARLFRRPFVYRNIGDPRVWGRVRLSDLRVGAPARSAATVVALYPGSAEVLEATYRLRPDRIRVIPRGVPTERFSPADPDRRQAARGALGLDPERTWLAYVGALSTEKDPLLALAALGHLPDDIGLVVAGGGAMADEVDAAARHLGDRVRLLGVLDDVRAVYDAADALVLPSRTEGIPGTAVEAGLCGLPTVTFDVGGTASVVLDGVTGRVLTDRDPAAFAAAVLDVLEHAGAWGAAARDRCTERFSMTSVGRAWEDLHRDLTAPRGADRVVRVLQVIGSTDRRGAEVFAVGLGERLGDDPDLRVETVALRSGPVDGLAVRTLGPGRFHPTTCVRLLRAVRNADVVVVHGGPGLWPGTVAAGLARRPVVYRSIGEPSFWGAVPLVGLRVGAPLRRARRVVALYDRAVDDLRRVHRLRPERVVVIPNAVDADAFPAVDAAARAAARRSVGLPESATVVGYIGSMSDEKRPDWVLESAHRRSDLHLLLVGTGPLLASVREQAAGLGGRVVVVGSTEDPAAMLAAMDVLVLPSRTEGMPAALIEAALVGIPAVATDVGGVGELATRLGGIDLVGRDDRGGFLTALDRVLERDPRDAPERAEAERRYDLGAVVGPWRDAILDAARSATPR